MKWSAVILAGGQSSRMGRDKAFIPVAGQNLIDRQLDTLVAAGAEDVYLSGRPGVDYSSFGCQLLLDQFMDAGPLAGIHAALLQARHPLLLVLAVDMPAMHAAFLQGLLMASTGSAGVIPRVDGKIEPLAAIYPRTALGLLESRMQAGNLSAGAFAEACVKEGFASFFDVPPECLRLFQNLNTPEDL